jgi:polysaccharide export outer membrane protein
LGREAAPPMKVAVLLAGLFASFLGGCSFDSPGLSQSIVVGQATPGSEIAYDVVKVDEAVIQTIAAQTPPPFRERFKKYTPPPEQKIAIGDVLSVVIWEASPEGLFGYSLWDLVSAQGAPLAQAVAGALLAPGATGSAASVSPLSAAMAIAAGGTPSPSASLGLLLPSGDAASAAAQGGGVAAALAAAQRAGGAAQSGGVVAGGSAQQLALALAARQRLNQATSAAPPDPGKSGEVGRPGTRIPVQEVGPGGTITVPYAGNIPVTGRTPNEVQQAIEQRLAAKAVNPQALVVVQRSVANSVTVGGELIAGKRIALNPGGERLLDVIAAAGGSQAPVHETFVRLSRDGVTATVPLATLVDHPEENIYAQPDDVLTLVRRAQTYSVFGATGQNAAITFNRDRLSLSEALAQAGGLLDDRADPRAVFLFRYEPVAVVKALGQPLATRAPEGISPIAYRLDLNDAKSYLLAKNFPVRDKDVVFVANAEIMPVYRAFTALQNVTGPIVTGLLTCQNGKC